MRQGNLFSDPVKKMDTKLLLQLLDLNGDGGLGVSQMSGCLGKALILCNLQKGADLAKFYRKSPLIIKKF